MQFHRYPRYLGVYCNTLYLVKHIKKGPCVSGARSFSLKQYLCDSLLIKYCKRVIGFPFLDEEVVIVQEMFGGEDKVY